LTRVVAVLLVAVLAAAAFVLARRGDRSTGRDARGAVPPRAYLDDACELSHDWAVRIHRGWRPGSARAHDLAFVPRPPVYIGGPINTAHSGPYDFLQEVPLVLYGRGYVEAVGRAELGREVTVADLAPTWAHLMGFDEFPRRRGRPLTEVVSTRADPPRLLVTAVIDGGGWNVLEHWPDAWPNLKRLIDAGVNVEGAIVGSSPSITPAIHTNLSTGAWPRDHGVTSTVVRTNDRRLVGAFSRVPRYAGSDVDPVATLRMTTLPDLWDRAMGNDPVVAMVGFGNYIMGMVGHGSALAGGDKDIVALEQEGRWATQPRFFSLPPYLNSDVAGPEHDITRVDRRDGRLDGLWRGHDIAPLDATPALAPWQHRTLAALVRGEGMGGDDVTDLLYVNYKAPDAAGHKWNMTAIEQSDAIRSVDDALGDLVDMLDREVGRDGYVLAITADHGQTPLVPEGWPIDGVELKADLQRAFDNVRNKRGIIIASTATTYFVSENELELNGVTPAEVASFLSRYTLGDNTPEASEIREGFEDRLEERIFSGVIPGSALDEVLACTRASGGTDGVALAPADGRSRAERLP
jgi:hypothetical protein